MITNSEKALNLFKNGYNCSQSVLSVFSEDFGLSTDSALKLASPFGAGISYMQETCGAVTGALMAIGLKFGKGENGTNEDKERAYKKSQYFFSEFRKIHGSVRCRDLMEGLDMNTSEGMAKIHELNLFQINCARYVQTAVEITEKIINK